MEKFESQLPEGLELIGRALRAGHALTGGIKLAADEFDDPLGPEFEKTLDEINFGISVTDALKNLAGRIDCPDLRYFIVSVILQRESGGNLAEIIDNIAYLIRERFKFRGKVQVLSAEGKLTAIILVALPFFVLIVLYFMNPAYLSVLFDESAGRIVVGIALSMMVVGIIVIKKVINIKV
jgi:tight adherence protein B